MVSIKDIASLAGVSVSTVSNALNNRKNISEAKRQEILRICRELNYQPNLMGQQLKNGSSNIIAFNFSDFERTFYLEIIHGLHACLEEQKYNFIICTSKSSRIFLRKNLTCGAICLDYHLADEYLQKVAGPQYPIVVMDRIIDNPYIVSVVVDNYPAMYEMVETLVGKGLRRFAFLSGLRSTLDNKERYGAFRDALNAHDVPFNEKYYYCGDYREESGYRMANVMLLEPKLPEVLVCANDNMANGAINTFTEHGVRVPEDIQVTGFDDCDIAPLANLTTVSIPRFESGYLATSTLIDVLEHGVKQNIIKIAARVVWRKSAGNS